MRPFAAEMPSARFQEKENPNLRPMIVPLPFLVAFHSRKMLPASVVATDIYPISRMVRVYLDNLNSGDTILDYSANGQLGMVSPGLEFIFRTATPPLCDVGLLPLWSELSR